VASRHTSMRLTLSGAEKLAVSTPIDPTRMEVRCDRLTVYFRFKVFPWWFLAENYLLSFSSDEPYEC